MRLVILGRIPFSTIDGTGYARIILTQESARISIAHPSVQFSYRFLHLEFHAVSISLRIDDIRLQMVVHQDLGGTAIIQIINQLFVISFYR